MRKILLILALLPSVTLGAAKKWTYPENPKLDDELANIYAGINNVPNGIFKASSMTLQGLTVDSITVHTGLALVGVTNGVNASAGNIGEVIFSSAPNTSFGSSTNFGSVINIVLSAGDWDVSALGETSTNGATVSEYEIGIDTVSNNSASGLVPGYNAVDLLFGASHTGSFDSLAIPPVQVNVASQTTVWLTQMATYTGGPPKMAASIRARRMR